MYLLQAVLQCVLIDHLLKKKVNMIRKYHNHTLQANPRYHEDEPLNIDSNNTSVNQ